MSGIDATILALSERPAATAVLLDFDGSIANIVEDPADARPLPDAVAVLRQLAAAVGRVGVVSGRPVEFLAEHLPVPGVHFVGIYGFESLVDGVHRVDPRVEPFVDAVDAAADEADARLPGVLVERKGRVSVTLHWRMTPDREADVRTVAHDLAARYGLDAPQRGKMALELRPPVEVDKGHAVEALVAGFAVAAFAGDDVGDVPAFAAIAAAATGGRIERGVRIGVHSPEAPPELAENVDVLVDGPRGLIDLLDAVARRCRG